MRHLISLKEQSKKELLDILDLAAKLKAIRFNGGHVDALRNKSLIMLFQKTSTRTRLSFEAAMTELGGHAVYLDSRTTQLSLTDFCDEIRAIMHFGSILMFRALKAEDVMKAASCDLIPVIDACSEKYHPAQALGDILTMIEHSGGLRNIKKVAWLGIENNVSNTLQLACAKLGVNFAIASPEVDPDSIDRELKAIAKKTGKVMRTKDIAKALEGADYVHTDTWMNMEFFDNGKVKPAFEKEFQRRKDLFSSYQLNAKKINKYCPNARIMHCMPCHIGYEITRDAIDHPNSVIFDQAENRLHIEKAIIMWLLGKTV